MVRFFGPPCIYIKLILSLHKDAYTQLSFFVILSMLVKTFIIIIYVSALFGK